MVWWVSPACLALLLALASQVQPPARELPSKPAPGTASISGIVLTDDADAHPLRRVRVFLNSSDDEVARTTISDDVGRFSFEGLRAGRYTVGGTKEGYVTSNYGARRPGGPGAPFTLADRQALADLTLTLPRGAVITGVIMSKLVLLACVAAVALVATTFAVGWLVSTTVNVALPPGSVASPGSMT